MNDGKICPFHGPRRANIITIYCNFVTDLAAFSIGVLLAWYFIITASIVPDEINISVGGNLAYHSLFHPTSVTSSSKRSENYQWSRWSQIQDPQIFSDLFWKSSTNPWGEVVLSPFWYITPTAAGMPLFVPSSLPPAGSWLQSIPFLSYIAALVVIVVNCELSTSTILSTTCSAHSCGFD